MHSAAPLFMFGQNLQSERSRSVRHCAQFSTGRARAVFEATGPGAASGAPRRTLPRRHTERGKPSDGTLNQRHVSLSLARNSEDGSLSQRGQMRLWKSWRRFTQNTGPRTQGPCMERLKLHRCDTDRSVTWALRQNRDSGGKDICDEPREQCVAVSAVPVAECERGFWTP